MKESYNHIIIGAGAAGLQLMLGLLADPDRQKETILVIDPDEKTKNDRTWCFWEEDEGLYDEVVHKAWHKGKFISKEKDIPLAMEDYQYKMIRSLDFYNYTREKAKGAKNLTWVQEEVASVNEKNEVKTGAITYTGDYVFDSRITDDFNADKTAITIAQHFLGWIIRTEDPVFDPETFTMMDFRENKEDNCSFTYILPLDEKTALVEFTFFSEDLLSKEEYVVLLKNYIEQVLQIPYEIIEEEVGVIPMTNFPFAKGNKQRYIKIGTGGGWVKPSTGYSFRNSQRYVEKILANIRAGRPPARKLISQRHRFLDTIFIKVLRDNNASGEKLFEKMYSGLSTKTVFRFLDEQSSLSEDFRIMLLFPELKFIASFFSALKAKFF